MRFALALAGLIAVSAFGSAFAQSPPESAPPAAQQSAPPAQSAPAAQAPAPQQAAPAAQPSAPAQAQAAPAAAPAAPATPGPALVNGKWNVPGAPQDSQTVPSKFSARNAELDKMSIEARQTH